MSNPPAAMPEGLVRVLYAMGDRVLPTWVSWMTQEDANEIARLIEERRIG